MSANHYAAAVVRDPGVKSPAAAPGAEPSYMLPFVLVTGPSLLWAIGANLNDVLIRHKKSVRAYRLQISGIKQLSSAVASSPHCRPAGDGEARIPTRPPRRPVYSRCVSSGLRVPRSFCLEDRSLYTPSAAEQEVSLKQLRRMIVWADSLKPSFFGFTQESYPRI
jgi:hypothetical protein